MDTQKRELIDMLLKCPHCGKELDLPKPPEAGAAIRCTNPECGRSFSVEEGLTASRNSAGEALQNAVPGQEGTKEVHVIAKNLAQDYFSDIPEQAVPELPAQELPTVSADEADVPEPRYLDEDAKEGVQLHELLQFGQEAEEKRKQQESAAAARLARQPRFVREKKNQGMWYWILLIVMLIVQVGRIFATRMAASIEQFSVMQPQIIPSFLYLIAAIILLYRLIRRTSRPQWLAAGLLFLPQILDYWYLFPGLMNILYPDMWLGIGSTAKILISIFALVMSINAGKHPARKYKEAEIQNESAS